jgi:hypothetical protein
MEEKESVCDKNSYWPMIRKDISAIIKILPCNFSEFAYPACPTSEIISLERGH